MRKKIVFVQAPLRMDGRYAEIAKGITVPPLGLCSLAAVTRQEGYDTQILDALVEGWSEEETARRIVEEKPDYVGFGCTTVLIHPTGRVAQMVKDYDGRITTIVGGVHMIALPMETMERFPGIDLGVTGEGEDTLLELLAALEDKRDLADVKGLAYRTNGKVHLTELRPYIKDLDRLPFPAWDLLPSLDKHYQQSFSRIDRLPGSSVITSRGCYAHCIFCYRAFGTSFRAHGAEYVSGMLRYLIKNYGIRSFAVEDDNFAAFRARLRELAPLMVKEMPDISWSCASRVDVVNPEALKLMKQAGCWSISYGIESGSQRILDHSMKKITLEHVERAIHWTKEVGIRTKGYFILGHPMETVESILETIEFAKRLPLDDFQISFMQPFPGTDLYHVAHQYGTFDNDWEKMNLYSYPTFIPHGLRAEQMFYYSKKAFREFYLRPRIIWGHLKRVLSQPESSAAYFAEGIKVLKFLLKGEARHTKMNCGLR